MAGRTGIVRASFFAACIAALAGFAAPGEATTLKVAGATPALTMDPHATADFTTTAIFDQIYDGLVGLSDDLQPVPGLATAWTFDGTRTWRFTLRSGVVFDDGTPMTAEDVAFSINRQRVSPFYSGLFGNIENAVAIDSNTVDVISKTADPILPRRMTRLYIMSEAWLKAHDSVAIPSLGAQGSEAFTVRHANGTGPWILKSDDATGVTTIERNPHYWGNFSGNVDEVIYQPIAADPTRVAGLISGQLDLVTDLPLQDEDRVKNSPGFTIGETPQLQWMELEMDGTRDVALDTSDKNGAPLKANPFKDARVRLAIAEGVDENAIVQRIMGGKARIVGIPAVPGLGGYQQDLDVHWPYDPVKAKALLAEAGYPNGFATQLNCPLERYVNTQEICNAVASMLARIGIDVHVRGMPWPEFARMLTNGPMSSFHLIGAGPNSWDTQDTFTAIMMTRNPTTKLGGFNWAMWTNPTLDAIGTELQSTFDPKRRDALYRQGLQLGKDQVHAVYLHQAMLTWGMKANVSATVRADGTPLFKEVVMK